MSISERIRPNVEAAPWVITEVGKLEVSYEALKAQLAELEADAEAYKSTVLSLNSVMMNATKNLAAANERIMELDLEATRNADLNDRQAKMLAAEREVSDKLVEALCAYQKAGFGNSTDFVLQSEASGMARAALAEVAAIRAGTDKGEQS